MWTHFVLSHCGYPVCTGYEDFVLASVHWLRGFMITQCKMGNLPIAHWVGTFCISQCTLAKGILIVASVHMLRKFEISQLCTGKNTYCIPEFQSRNRIGTELEH